MPFINFNSPNRIYKNNFRISQVYDGNTLTSLWGQRDPHWDNLLFNIIEVDGEDKSANNVNIVESLNGNKLIQVLHPTGLYDMFAAPIPVPDNIKYTIDFIFEFITNDISDKTIVDYPLNFYSIEYSTSTGRDSNKFKFLWDNINQKFQFYENGNLREILSFQVLKNTKYYISINRDDFDVTYNQIKIFINGIHYPTNDDFLPKSPLIGTDALLVPNTRFLIPPNNSLIYYKLRFTKGSLRHWNNYDHIEEIF